MLGPDDAPVLERVAPEVFDNLVDARWSAEFLADSRHHLAVALDADTVVGIASAVHYLHPDKPPELWINEVSVTTTHRAAGVGRRLLHAIFKRGRKLGCLRPRLKIACSKRRPTPAARCVVVTLTSLIQSSGGLSGCK